jgi:hypothetical protein
MTSASVPSIAAMIQSERSARDAAGFEIFYLCAISIQIHGDQRAGLWLALQLLWSGSLALTRHGNMHSPWYTRVRCSPSSRSASYGW